METEAEKLAGESPSIQGFDEFLKSKKIDPESFKKGEESNYQQLKMTFDQVHPQSFVQQKLFLINKIRKTYHYDKEEGIKSAKDLHSKEELGKKPKPLEKKQLQPKLAAKPQVQPKPKVQAAPRSAEKPKIQPKPRIQAKPKITPASENKIASDSQPKRKIQVKPKIQPKPKSE